ncbi:hypothetical protein V8E53_003181 [Lactarius tabidus]
MPVALHLDAAERHHLDSNSTSAAYNACHDFEGHATNNGSLSDLMNARILGHLIIYSPSNAARHVLFNVILSCNNDYASLSALGSTFLDYYIYPCEQFATHIRDGFRCVFSRKYDLRVRSVAYLPVTVEEVLEAGGGEHTDCVHIAPDSTYFTMTANSPDKEDYSASVLAVLPRFGKVHSLFNMMTMDKSAHDLFDRLEIWFERTFTDYLVAPDQVMLTTPDPLALHATCAQVAPLSGAREYLDQILEETEEMEVLAQDGTSSKVLHHAHNS